ncbi:hypothetical protein [Cellulomonas sp. NPDC089187]|uniref:hypothetical protein n=1 Tax=Cellulomonas sp. NPDC089187 TaxID=3154970 RepID=UPI00343A8E0A
MNAPARVLLGRALVAVPERAVLVLLALGLAGTTAAQFSAVRPQVVFPLAAVIVVVGWRSVPTPDRVDRRAVLAAVVLVLGVGAWIGWNWTSVAQYVVVNRDPGFLTLRALWLSEHPSALIPVGSAADAAAAVAGASAGTEAFWLDDGLLYAQGNTMLPTLLAVEGWFGGPALVMAGNLLIVAVALFGTYALARRLTGPWWALLPTAALGVCLPFVMFARAAYTEPLTLAFLTGGLAIAVGAWHRGAASRRGGEFPHVLAGAMVGAVAAARIDGAVAVSGFAVGTTLAVALFTGPRSGIRRQVAGGIVAACAIGLVGWVDVARLSPDYLETHRSQLGALGLATVLLVAACLGMLMAPSSVWGRLGGTRTTVARWACGGVALLALALVTRPWWYQAHRIDPDSGAALAVQVLQSSAGQVLDGTRSYDELSVAWAIWYLGAAAVVCGFVGWAVLAHRAFRRPDPGAAVAVVSLMVAGVFPLVLVNITPDQIWAVRRLLPATFPALLVGAAVTMHVIVEWLRARGVVWQASGRALVAAAAVAVIAVPVSTWPGVIGTVELSGRYDQARAVCGALDSAGVERIAWVHSSPFRYLATLRVMCDVEVVEFVQTPDRAQWTALADAWGDSVAVASFDAADVPWASPQASAVGRTSSTTMERTLIGPPHGVDTVESEVWIGLLRADGMVDPLGVRVDG